MTRDERRHDPALALSTAALVLLLCLLLSPALLNDPDTYWHVRVGRDVLDAGALPRLDRYSWTMAGEPWIAKEWLSQVLFASAFRLGGWAAVATLAAAAIALAFALLARFVSTRLGLLPSVVLLGLAFLLASGHFLARPHALALPVLVAWAGLLATAAERGRRPPWWVLGLMVVWANLHGSFLLGLALAVGFALDALVCAPREARGRLGREWAWFVVAAAASSLVTPYGSGTLGAAIDVLQLGAGLDVITEWRPADFGRVGPLEFVVLLAVTLVLVTGFRLRWPRALMLVGVVYLALAAVRNGDVLGLTAPILLAAPLSSHLTRDRDLDRVPWVVPVVLALAFVPVAGLAWSSDLVPATQHAPKSAVAALEQHGTGRVLNDYSFGGYLIHVGVPTYIDGRTELFGGAAVVRHDAAVAANPPSLLEELLEADGVQATLLPPGSPALAYLDESDDWRRVHADEIAVVHVRATDGDH